MSEPMSSVEIEDVLSSIRRLVSEDLRPASARSPAAQPEPPEAPEAPAAVVDPVASKLILTPALRVVPPEDKVDAVDSPQGADAQDWDPAQEAAFVAVDDSADLLPEDGDRAGADILTLSLPAEAAATAPDATWVEVETPDAALWADAPSTAPADGRAPDAAWMDAAEAEVRRQLAADPAAAEDDTASARTMEEDILREIVRDIIREELQGALGERITRNVRKLVRAEIARAAALRDFD